MESTWEQYDLPVLRAIVERADDTGQWFEPGVVSMDTNLDHLIVKKAVRRLASERPPYFEVQRNADDEIWIVGNPTGYARRTVGQWPTPEGMIDRLVEAIQKAAEAEPDPDKKSRLRSIGTELAGVARGVAVEVFAKVITGGA